MLSLFTGSGVGPTVFYLAVSIVLGLLLGKLKVAHVSLGITWVLFIGIILSALGISLNGDMLHIIKEFGLILFVVAVGFQVGPNFFASFKKGGLKLNLCAIAIVALGVLTTVLISRFSGEPLEVMAGVYTGAITNTPGMSAAQQTVGELGICSPETIANGYAVAYPLGVVGLIVGCLIIRAVCKVKLDNEPMSDANQEDVQTPKSETTKAAAQRHKILLIPIFLTIGLGIVLGSIPVPIGMSAPVKLGLAGGPLVMAILVSWIGVKKGWIDTDFMGSHGIWMLREVGIALFLAAVGLGAGGSFIDTIKAGGYMWILYGVIITMVPTLLVGIFARLVLKVNYYTLMGVIGGATTDPPTLAFANTVATEQQKATGSTEENQLPNMGYATVYPLTMFLRIFTAQLLVLLAV